ncbi:MAG: hypothetical protein LUH58_00590 [Lachnospiraceae bacterium]|nr:hypothetical protein [Lachnospiraceae bacterium]
MGKEKQEAELTSMDDGREITDDVLDGVAGGDNIYTFSTDGHCSQCGTSVEERGSLLYCPKCKRYVHRAFF